MTIDLIRASNKDFLTPKEVAEVLKVDPQNLRLQAKTDARRLGFPVTIIGTRVRIPRIPFLMWFDGGSNGLQDN